MSSPSKRRDMDVMKLMMSDYSVEPINDANNEFNVEFYGPKESLYEGGVWKVRVELPDAYPYKSPSIGFLNKIFHPNVDELSGSVCLDVINQSWSPMFDLLNVFEVFLPQLLLYPNPSDPLNGDAASLMMKDRKQYEQKVKEYCDRYAKKDTIDDLERDVLQALAQTYPPIYPVGPLHLLEKQNPLPEELNSIQLNLLKEDLECLKWLDSQQPNSVIYVNFGSVVRITKQQLIEFAWGLANSKQNFLWSMRHDLVIGESAVLPPEFEELTRNSGFISDWCPQEKILNHPSVAGFLTHCGWNSILESIGAGVPMICWPAYAEQPTNCWFICNHWGIGMEITEVNRAEVEKLVRGLLVDDKGKEMKKKAMEWKNLAEEYTRPGGLSHKNFYEKVVDGVLLSKFQKNH